MFVRRYRSLSEFTDVYPSLSEFSRLYRSVCNVFLFLVAKCNDLISVSSVRRMYGFCYTAQYKITLSVQFDGHSQTLDAIAKLHTAAAAAAR